MRPPRFVWTAHGLVLETPIALTPRQRHVAKVFAIGVFGQRFRALPAGDRRDGVARVLAALRAGDFIERLVPANDSARDLILANG